MFRLLATAVIAALLVTGSFLPPSQSAAVPDAAIPEKATPVTTVEQEKAPPVKTPQTAAPAETFLTEQEAKDIALSHAGLSADTVKGLKAEFEKDDGHPEWEVEFYSGDWEYDYTIHGKSGKILKSQKEKEIPDVPATQPPETQPPAETFLTAQEAKDIALSHAGLSANTVKGLKAEFEKDDGRPEWEVEFYVGGFEYSYEIHGKTGKILDWEKEFDD